MPRKKEIKIRKKTRNLDTIAHNSKKVLGRLHFSPNYETLRMNTKEILGELEDYSVVVTNPRACRKPESYISR